MLMCALLNPFRLNPTKLRARERELTRLTVISVALYTQLSLLTRRADAIINIAHGALASASSSDTPRASSIASAYSYVAIAMSSIVHSSLSS